MFEGVRYIVEEAIGKPKKDGSDWLEYNCPYCAQEKGVESDGKFNLAVNYGEDLKTKPFFHCWRCGNAGKLVKLVKDFGTKDALRRYRSELKSIRNSALFRLNFDNDIDELKFEEPISLPKDYRKIDYSDRYSYDAIKYLESRGLDDFFIETYDIGYVPYWSQDKNMRSRIIIPSYDEYGELNYYVARDYTGWRKYRKYNNPDVKKTLFVFNEDRVNWYEDVTLVEGVFDHMVIPNSIPLLGKTLKKDYATFKAIVEKAKLNVNVLLDDDATADAIKIYKLLNSTKLNGRIRLIVCPNGFDASDIYRKFGKRGIKQLMQRGKQLSDFELISGC